MEQFIAFVQKTPERRCQAAMQPEVGFACEAALHSFAGASNSYIADPEPCRNSVGVQVQVLRQNRCPSGRAQHQRPARQWKVFPYICTGLSRQYTRHVGGQPYAVGCSSNCWLPVPSSPFTKKGPLLPVRQLSTEMKFRAQARADTMV